MKRLFLILIAFALLVLFSACRQVVVTSADELTSKSWCTETLSGIKAQLIFENNTASLKITGDEEVTLTGHLSVDPKRFYITSTENFRTYTFLYEVFSDKVKIVYNGEELLFYPCNVEVTPDEY